MPAFSAQNRVITTAAVVHMLVDVTDLERLTRDYWTAVLRVRRMPVPERDKVVVLADVEAIYWKERAQWQSARQRNATSSL